MPITSYRVRIDDWRFLPLPEPLLQQLDWKEGDQIEVELVGDALVLTKSETQTLITQRKESK